MAGNYPRIPGITLGLGLVHYPLLPATHRLSLLVQSRRLAPLAAASRGESDGQHVPVPMAPHATKTDPAPKTGGIVVTVDDPMRRSHHPRAFAPSRQQCCEVIIDGPMQFAFADPLRLPTLERSNHCYSTVQTLPWASHLAAGHVSDTPVKRGSDAAESHVRQ